MFRNHHVLPQKFHYIGIGLPHARAAPILQFGLPVLDATGDQGSERQKQEDLQHASCYIFHWLKLRLSRANCKILALCNFQGPFPLTPALSLRERENQEPRCKNSKRLGFSNALPTLFPLPEGEGWGEGERIVRIPEMVDCCNPLSVFVAL